MNTQRVNILYLSTARYAGGAELSLQQLVNNLAKSRFNISIALPADADTEVFKLFQRYSQKIIKIRMPLIKKSLNPLAVCRIFNTLKNSGQQISAIISAKNINIIHANNDHAALLSAFITEIPGVIKIWQKRDLSFPEILCKWIMKRHDKIIAVSNFVKENCSFLTAKEIPVCYSGVDINVFSENISKSEARRKLDICDTFPIIANVGNNAKWKKQDLFIKIINEIKSHFPEVKGVIAGNNLTAKDNLIIYKRLDFKKMKYLYAAADIFINTAEREPLGRSIIEASASGTPVISVSGGGAEEIINLTKSGSLSEKSNLNSLLINTLHKIKTKNIKTNVPLPETLGKIKKHFSPEKTADTIQQHYFTS